MKYQLVTTGRLTPSSGLNSPTIRGEILRKIESDHDLKDYLDQLSEEIQTFKAIKLNSDGTLLWEIETTRSLTKSEEKVLINYLTGQCSDGWGEGFEQYPAIIKGSVEYFYSPWKRGTTAKIIKKNP